MKFEVLNPTYHNCMFPSNYGDTEVWVSPGDHKWAFGINQDGESILLNLEEFKKLQALVNHAAEILKG